MKRSRRGAKGKQGPQGSPGSPGSPGAAGANGARFTPFDRTNTPPSSDYIGTWPPGAATLNSGGTRFDTVYVSVGTGIPKTYRHFLLLIFTGAAGPSATQVSWQILGSASNSTAEYFDPWTGSIGIDIDAVYIDLTRFRYQVTLTTTKPPNEVNFELGGSEGTTGIGL